MRAAHVYTSFILVTKALLRRQIISVLLVVIPAAFFLVIYLTTKQNIFPFRLASITKEVILIVNARNISLVFFGIAATGFLTSFLALTLIQKNISANRRLIVCGYYPYELFFSHMLVLLLLTILISVYIAASLTIFFAPLHLFNLIVGLVLAGWVYGCYGLLIGSLITGELEGILLIVLLANIDAGWLQNPLFYADAENQIIIRYLPAFFPSQTAIMAAFSDYGAALNMLYSFLYGLVFFIIANGIYYLKMKRT